MTDMLAQQPIGYIEELRGIAAYMKARTPLLVALSSPGDPNSDSQAHLLYDGSAATLFTVHLDRNITGQGGIWRPVRQAWDPHFYTGLPWTNDEPIGPQSSVNEDDDPLRLAMAAGLTWLNGGAGYTVHTGAGVRGGGAEDRARGRVANIWEVRNIEQIFAAINAMRAMLPSDLPNFAHHNSNRGFPGYPFDVDKLVPILERNGLLRAFAATAGNRCVVLPMLAVESIPFTAREAMHLDVRDPLTGALLEQHELWAGETFTLSPRDAAVLVGR